MTTAPTQALFLMNSQFAAAQAQLWAGRVLADTSKSTSGWITETYSAAYGRGPRAEEVKRAEEFLSQFERALAPVEQDAAARKKKAVEAFCHALMQSTEFRFLN